MATQTSKNAIAKCLQAGFIGGVIAAGINLILYFLGNALNGTSMVVDPPGPPPEQSLPIYPVIMLSIVPGIVAGLLYGLLKRFTSRARVIFLIFAIIIFATFFIGPFGAAKSTVTLWILQLMHVGAAAPIITMLFRADG